MYKHRVKPRVVRDTSKQNLAEKSVPQKSKFQLKVSQETLPEANVDGITESFNIRSPASSIWRFKTTGLSSAALRRSSVLQPSLTSAD